MHPFDKKTGGKSNGAGPPLPFGKALSQKEAAKLARVQAELLVSSASGHRRLAPMPAIVVEPPLEEPVTAPVVRPVVLSVDREGPGLAGPCPPVWGFPWGPNAVRVEDTVYEVREMDSAMALEILKHNHPGQRHPSEAYVARLRADMDAGNWVFTEEAIAFGEDGKLVNGQHRCLAQSKAKRSSKYTLTWNLDFRLDAPRDQGKKRDYATILKINKKHVSAIDILRSLEAGHVLAYPSLAQAREVYGRYELWLDGFLTMVPYHKSLSGPEIAAMVFALPCGEAAAVQFAKQVASGEMLQRGDPAYAYRAWRVSRRKQASKWQTTLAMLNCLRFAIHHMPLSNVHTGRLGYRAFCARRRALKVVYTPSASVVNASGWVPSKHDDSDALLDEQASL